MNNPSNEETKNNIDETIKQLAALTDIAYEQARKDAADKLGIRVNILDEQVEKSKKINGQDFKKEAVMAKDVEPWPETVEPASLLEEVYTTIKRYIVCEDETAVAATLWTAFTWFIGYVDVAPIALITAPERRCGKTQLLAVMGKMSYRALLTSNISPAAVFRLIEAESPTLIIDEADAFLKQHEELRGVINSGHTRETAYVIRTEGENHEPKRFGTWGAKIICGIGAQAETIMDRSIVLELRRKLSEEHVESQRRADPVLFKRLSSKLARFALDSGQEVAVTLPDIPRRLNDRAQDNWSPLLAIAEVAGGEWLERAKNAAIKISGQAEEAATGPNELLADIREIFTSRPNAKNYPTRELVDALNDDPLKAWSTYNRGYPLTQRQLCLKLKAYGLLSKDIRHDGRVLKGYDIKMFKDAFDRYLSPVSAQASATALQFTEMSANTVASNVANTHPCSATENQYATDNSLKNMSCSSVADISDAPDDGDVFENIVFDAD